MAEGKSSTILTQDERAALVGLNDARALGQRGASKPNVSARLVMLGLVGKDADDCLAVTPWGKELLRTRPPQADGVYTRTKELYRGYDYSVIWGEGEQGTWWWEANVRYNGDLKGTLNGNVLTPLTPVPNARISA